MKSAAFIPARGGSQRIERKNLAKVNGRSLLARTIDAAGACDSVYVSTDDSEIAAVAASLGAEVVLRPAHLARHTSQIEDAITHWWRGMALSDRPEAIVMLQPTSPLRLRAHVEQALRMLPNADSVVGVVVDHKRYFRGRIRPEETGPRFMPDRPIGYRPRTQEVRPEATETGALYATTAAAWERSGLRMSGHMLALEMPWWASVDVDEPEDLWVADALARVVDKSGTIRT